MLEFIIAWFYHEFTSLIDILKLLILGRSRFHESVIKRTVDSKVNILGCDDNHEISENNTMFLCNHRAFSDFFIDATVAHASYLARMMVWCALPFSCLYGWSLNRILFINRGNSTKQQLSQLVKENSDRNRNLIVYPESHRQQTSISLPLKYGMIREAYRQNIPIQVIQIKNKEDVFCQQTMTSNTHVTCYIFIGKILRPQEAEDIDDWCVIVKKEWDIVWKKMYCDDNNYKKYVIKKIEDNQIERDKLFFLRCMFITIPLLSVVFMYP